MCHLAKFRTPTHSSLKSAGGAAEEGYGRTRVAAPSMAQPAYPAPDPSPQKLSCNQLLQVLASSSQPCRVAGRLLQLSQLCAGGTDTLSRNLRHRRRGARHQLMTARQSPILPVVIAAGSHHLACRCRRSRLQLRWVAEEQSRLLDRLFHACTFGLGRLLAPGTPVPVGGHLSAPTETSPARRHQFRDAKLVPPTPCKYRLPRLFFRSVGEKRKKRNRRRRRRKRLQAP